MQAFQEAGISLEGMSPPERFDIHRFSIEAGAATR
jgi:hypothetical protein